MSAVTGTNAGSNQSINPNINMTTTDTVQNGKIELNSGSGPVTFDELEQVTKEAEGEAARFLSVYETYKTNKDVTTQRLFLERMEDVLSRSNKIIIDNEAGGSGVVPYLPLNELQKRSGETQ